MRGSGDIPPRINVFYSDHPEMVIKYFVTNLNKPSIRGGHLVFDAGYRIE